MTREEQITQRAKETALSNIIHEARGVYSAYGIGFFEGAKWADKTMIQKVCEWLKEQEEMIGISFHEDFIERLKQAMKE